MKIAFRRLAMLALVISVAALATASPAGALDFACYRAAPTSGATRFTPHAGVQLTDAYATSSVEARRPKLLCAPTNAGGSDPAAPSRPDHLEDYLVKPAARFAARTRQQVTDRFGTHTLDVKKPVGLDVPSAKSRTAPPSPPSNPAIDHFQCYKVRPSSGSPKFVRATITLQDQFGSMTVQVRKPSRVMRTTL